MMKSTIGATQVMIGIGITVAGRIATLMDIWLDMIGAGLASIIGRGIGNIAVRAIAIE